MFFFKKVVFTLIFSIFPNNWILKRHINIDSIFFPTIADILGPYTPFPWPYPAYGRDVSYPKVMIDFMDQYRGIITLPPGRHYPPKEKVPYFIFDNNYLFVDPSWGDLLFISLLTIVCVLIAIAYYTLSERKIMAAMQRRKGPNIVGFGGLLQPLADGIKLLLKEMIFPRRANSFLFLLAPCITFVLSILCWIVIPFSGNYVIDLELGALFIYAVTSLEVYGIILAGWASNSKYAFLGSMRSAAQMISYEVSLGFILLSIGLTVGSYNLITIVQYQSNGWNVINMFPLVFIFFVSGLAETNRAPFDLSEAEAEIVSGYNIEYSGILFAMFFLGEYSNMLLFSALITLYFFGGWLPPFSFFNYFSLPEFWMPLKIGIFAFFFVWVRATLPRYRYDQLMLLGWKIFLPFTFGYFILLVGFFFGVSCEGGLPDNNYVLGETNLLMVL